MELATFKDLLQLTERTRAELLGAIGDVSAKVDKLAMSVDKLAVSLARLEERFEAHEKLPSHAGAATEIASLQAARHRWAGAVLAVSTIFSLLLRVLFR